MKALSGHKKWCLCLIFFILLVVVIPVLFICLNSNNDTKRKTDGYDSNLYFIHISFDDVSYCMQNLSSESYSSLWQEPFFSWLKTLHDNYGAKFSLYCFLDSLVDVPDSYSSDFKSASSWLKLGLHADSSSSNYATSTYEEGKASWDSFVENVLRITGTTLSIDRIVRLQNFYGSKEALLGMRGADCGALGFLSADDDRVSYYFTESQATYLQSNDHFTDYENGLVFLATDFRAEWMNSKSSYDIKESTVYEELTRRYSTAGYANSLSSFIFFTHETYVYSSSKINDDGAEWVEDACKFAYDNNICFDFAQNRTLSASYMDVYP